MSGSTSAPWWNGLAAAPNAVSANVGSAISAAPQPAAAVGPTVPVHYSSAADAVAARNVNQAAADTQSHAWWNGLQTAPLAAASSAPQSSLANMAAAIPAGLYGGVAGIINLPGRAYNAAVGLMHNLGAAGYGDSAKLPMVANENPTGYQPNGEAARMAYAAASSVPGLLAMQPEAAATEAVAPALGEAAARAVPSIAPIARGTADAIAAGAGALKGMPVARNLLPVAAGAATGQAASDAAPTPYKPLANIAGNLIGGGLGAIGQEVVAGVGNAAGQWLAKHGLAFPGTKIAVGETTATPTQAAQATQAVRAALGPEGSSMLLSEPDTNAVPGYEPTMGQVAPTARMVGLEKAFRSAYGPQFIERGEQQNQAQLDALSALGPQGNTASVGSYLAAQLQAADEAAGVGQSAMAGGIRTAQEGLAAPTTPEAAGASARTAIEAAQGAREGAANQAVREAQGVQESALSALPEGPLVSSGGATASEQMGAEARGQAMVARQAASNRVNALRDAINPDGNAGVQFAPFQQAVQDVYAGLPKSAPDVTSGEQSVIGKAQALGPGLAPLNEVFALRETVNNEISKALGGAQPDRAAAARLMQVKQGLDDAIAMTLDQHANFEAQQVAAGQLLPEETMLARMQAQADQHVAKLRAQEGAASSRRRSGNSVRSNAWLGNGFRAPAGAAGETGGGLGGTPGNPGMEATLRPLKPEELSGYRSYLGAAKNLKQTFDNGAVGDILAYGEHPTAAEVPAEISRARGGFQKQDAEVLGSLWNGKQTEAANLRQAQGAGITPDLLTRYAAEDLRAHALREDGSFDTAAYQRWRKAHDAGLNIFPETRAAFDGVAKAQQTLEAAQKAAEVVRGAHPLKGVGFNSEIMGRYWQKGDTGADRVRQFAADAGDNPEALRALDDYAVYTMRNENGLIKPDGTVDGGKLGKFRSDFAQALSARPELQAKLGSLQSAQEAYDAVAAEHEAAMKAYQTDTVKYFLNEAPDVAIARAFERGNPNKNIADLYAKTKSDKDALAGLQRAGADYIVKKFQNLTPQGTNETNNYINARAFRQFVDKNAGAVKSLFGGQGKNMMDAIAANLRRQAPRTTATAGSDTVPKAMGAVEHGLAPHGQHGGGSVVLTLIGENLGRMVGGEIGAGVGAGVGGAMARIKNVLQQSGVRTQTDLVREMILHPTTIGRDLLRQFPGREPPPSFWTRVANEFAASMAINQQATEAPR